MSITILVVDDSSADRLLIQNTLGEYSVLTASGGVEAIRILESQDTINLLILDLNMPDMDGFQVLEYLRGNERYNKLRTIILTVYDEVENEIKGLKLGAVDFLHKPIYSAALKARVDVHVQLILAEQALEQKLDKQILTFDMVFEQAPIGIGIAYNCFPEQWDNSAELKINPMYEKITGRPKEELVKLGWSAITHPDDLPEEIEKFRKLVSGEIKEFSMEKRYVRPDGSIVWAHVTVYPLHPIANNKFNYICLVQDITDKKQMEDEHRFITEHDKWTGLYNREYLVSLLEKHAKTQRGVRKALVGVNLSMAQLLTANYGYQYTQNLIKKVAEALSRFCSEKCLLFYPSENRFVFYVYDYALKCDLARLSGQIIETLESLLVTDRITGGIGILEIDGELCEIDVDSALRKLLIALGKSVTLSGKNFQVCFYNKELEALVNRERDIGEALSKIAADVGSGDELAVEFQPILDLRSGLICGFEALARLKTEKLGSVSPSEFIPIAEKTKLIVPIGEKVFYEAFCFLRKLKERGYSNVGVSVNVSVIQLLGPSFAANLFELIDNMQVDTKSICIEITESVFACDYDKINLIFEKLRSMGLQIAIDDFGTGYSSLAREKELKVDCMKIDKYFIDKLLYTDPSKAITGDIISMANKLGQYTIAEGVEHETQLRYLIANGCDRVQGYLLSRPLCSEKALEFLENYNIHQNGRIV